MAGSKARLRVEPLGPGDIKRLKKRLDLLSQRFGSDYLHTDPLQFVHRYSAPEDRELVGLLSSALAYGRVQSILHAVEAVLAVLGPHPRRWLDDMKPGDFAAAAPSFKHRFHNAQDLDTFLWLMAQVTRKRGSLEASFRRAYQPSHETLAPALAGFVEELVAGDPGAFHPGTLPARASVRHLLASPASGSACKRMFLFLRWMIRSDDLDLGVWPGLPVEKLLIPLDTHVFRLGQYLGLLQRRSPDLKAALELTGNLRRLDPADPVRYDFALARLGILSLCPRKRDPETCSACDLYSVCRLR
jgi:uncharacterized protein (TIGR02757 family)